MIYLIGVDHLIQYRNGIVPDYLYKEFSDFIKIESMRICPYLIAEEFSLEALNRVYASKNGTLAAIAAELGIEHRYCDPEEEDRKVLGIPYFADIRETVIKENGFNDDFILDDDKRKIVHHEAIKRSKKYWSVREQFWLDRLRDAIEGTIIFICGHEHIASFSERIQTGGYTCTTIDRFWMEGIFSDYSTLGI